MTVMTFGNDTINILPLFRFARTHFWLKIHKNLHRHSIYDQFVRIGDRHEVMIMPDKADSGALCIVSRPQDDLCHWYLGFCDDNLVGGGATKDKFDKFGPRFFAKSGCQIVVKLSVGIIAN